MPKATKTDYGEEPWNVAAEILRVAYIFPTLSLTITPELLWEFAVGADLIQHYQFREPSAAVSKLRSIVARIAFHIEESHKETIRQIVPVPAYLENCLRGITGVPSIHRTQWELYQRRVAQESERLGIKPTNPYGFETELRYTDPQNNQWTVSVQTQNNMKNGLPFLKTSSKRCQ